MANKGSSLATNQSLNMGDFLVSPNGNYTAIMQDDGNFVVYQGTGGTVIWASGVPPASVQGPYSAVMQGDGNFVVYAGSTAIWATNIIPGVDHGPYSAIMQNDGNFVVYQGTGAGAIALWAVSGPRGSSLATDQVLNMGAFLTSPGGNYKAIMQNDGNFVIYQAGSAIWASGVPPAGLQGPYRATMQGDGNFVVYAGSTAIWATNIIPGVDHGPYSAIMQNDGNFVVYQGTGTGRHAVWSINDIPYFYGNAGIPRSLNSAEVGHRYINANSLVFLTVDTTAVPSGEVALPGVRVNNHGQGFITISTLDESKASQPCGLPLSYLVVNRRSGTMGPLNYTAGASTIIAHANHVRINDPAAQPDSTILLTIDATPITESVHLPGLKVEKKGSGWFTVTTLGMEGAPSTGIWFNWMIVNGGSSALRGRGSAIPHGVHNIDYNSTAVSMPTAVFLTVDASNIPGDNVKLPGVKVRKHGNGWFAVTTAENSNAPSTGVPFDWLVVQPTPRWEEYGPTAVSGNCWSLAVDPNAWQVVYCGSSRGGVWKTLDGGQNWAPAWDQPQVGIYRVLVDPTTPSTVYALDFYLQVWISLDAGSSWNQLPSSPPSLAQANSYYGAVMTLASDGTLWLASLGGLAKLPPPLIGSTWVLDNPNPALVPCTDVAIGQDGTVYAAIQGSGVYQLPPNQTQWEAINTGETIVHKPMRLAVGQHTIVLNANMDIYTHTILTPTWNDWVSRGQWCCGDGQDGYALSVGISPTDDNHFLAFASGGWATFDGGATHFPDNDWGKQIFNDPSYIKCGTPPLPCDQLAVGQDDHQVVFFNDQCLALATDKGPRFSTDGGKHWSQTQDGFSRISDGPPISEFYNLWVSQPDQFGRVVVTGNVQDAGSQAIIGNRFGTGGGGGERGLSVPAAPINGHDATYNMDASTVHFYGIDTSAVGNPKLLERNVTTVPGPYYVAPPADPAIQGEAGFPAVNLVIPLQDSPVFPANIAVIATHPTHYDQALVGLANGDVYRSVAGSQGTNYRLLMQSSFGNTSVTSINFVTTNLAYVGYQNGGLVELMNPFGDSITRSGPTASMQPVVSVALDSQVSPARLYIAYSNAVWAFDRNGENGGAITGPQTSGLGAQLSGIGIVGMALDPRHRFLYVATGVGYGGTVWRKSLSLAASDAWDNFGAGLPDSVPITGLGIGLDQGLFISTVGRGLWWRRDLTG